ncbi:MAG: hypothetical protein JWN10_1338 [Solirubrobacterales bacterium]|nr:hypothetical protein [Solirubrobacterales bacterium]
MCALALCSCGNTLQDRPIPHNILEGLIAAPFPVYWLGASFEGMAVSEATRDPGGAYSLHYGDCLRGGEGTCVTAMEVVTSPDNSFLPGGSTATRRTPIRGIDALLARAGRTIVLPTSGVVVDIYASSAHAAAAAAHTIVPINQAGSPGAPLPPALPNTGFGESPLPTQLPPPLRPLGSS